MHPEAVLLVDDGDREIAESDLVLKQRMRADDEIDLAECEAVEDVLPFAAALASGERGDADACSFRQRRYRIEMLARQYFRRRHECCLPSGLDDRCRCGE